MIVIEDASLQNAGGTIAHGFFGREGGASQGLYKSLNCGIGSRDNPRAIQENKARICEHFHVPIENLITIQQIHSAKCFKIERPLAVRPEGDGLVTDRPGLALAVLTADCGPVLFSGVKNDGAPVIGAAHAGWSGALKGICEETILQMQNLGAVISSIKVAISFLSTKPKSSSR